MSFKSQTAHIYPEKMAALPVDKAALVDDIYVMAEANYDKGGDTIVEAMEPAEVAKEYASVKDAKRACRVRKSHEQDIRAEIW